MIHITITLEELTFKTLLVYYWHQLPTNEYALVSACLFLLQIVAEVFLLMSGRRCVVDRYPHLLANIVLIAAFLLSGCITVYTLLLADSPRLVPYWAGLGVFTCAYIGRDLTISLLKPKYSSYLEMALSERTVISGIFALIRYPLSASYLLEMAAFPLIAWNPISAAMLIIACLGIEWKIRHEERDLTRQFDEHFAAYRRTTRRLIPFIY